MSEPLYDSDLQGDRVWQTLWRAAWHVQRDTPWDAGFENAQHTPRHLAALSLVDLSKAVGEEWPPVNMPENWCDLGPDMFTHKRWFYPKGADLLRVRLETSLRADATWLLTCWTLGFGLLIFGQALYDILTNNFYVYDPENLRHGAWTFLFLGPLLSLVTGVSLWGPGPNGHRRVEAFADEGFYWLRLYGHGLHVKNWRLHGETFSERAGKKSRIKVGRWSIRLLRP